MDIFVNNVKTTVIQLVSANTVGDIKKVIKQWLDNNNNNNYHITRLIFNNGSELDPVVFNTNIYDNVNFETYKDVLNDSKLYIVLNDNNDGNDDGNLKFNIKNTELYYDAYGAVIDPKSKDKLNYLGGNPLMLPDQDWPICDEHGPLMFLWQITDQNSDEPFLLITQEMVVFLIFPKILLCIIVLRLIILFK